MKKSELKKLIREIINEQIVQDPNTVSPIRHQTRKDCCVVAQQAFDTIENVINDAPGIQEVMPWQFFMYIQNAKQEYLNSIKC